MEHVQGRFAFRLRSGALLVALLFGAARPSSAGEVALPSPDNPTQRSRETSEIRFWQLSLRPPVAEALAREFEKRNPGTRISVETLSWENGFEKLVLAIASHREPDVFELGSTWIPSMRSSLALAPLDALDARVGGELLLREPGRGAAGTDAMPWLLGTRVLFVNRALLRSAGIAHPPRTTEELFQACGALRRKHPSMPCIGLAAADPYAPWQHLFSFAWTADPGFIGPTVGVEDLRAGALLQAARVYERLRPVVRADRPAALDRDFLEGRVAMVISGAWLPLVIRDSGQQLDYEAAAIPALPGGRSHAFGGGEYLVLSRRTALRTESERFIEFLLERETLERVTREQPGLLPARRGVAAPPSLDPRTLAARQVMQRELETAATPPPDPNWAAAEQTFSAIADRILLRGSTAEEALAAAQAPLRRIERRTASGRRLSTRNILVFLELGAAVLLAVMAGGMYARRDRLHAAARVPWLAFFAALYAIPALYLVIVSFASTDLLAMDATYAGLRNYRELALDPAFLRAIVITLLFVIASVPATLALALVTAYGVRALSRVGRVCEALVYLPPILPVVVTATIVAALFAGGGLVDSLLAAVSLPVPEPSWLVNERAALAAVVVHAVWTSFGYYALLFAAALAAIPPNVREAALLDGARPWLRFRSIDWPAIRPVVLLVLLLHTVRSLQVFPEIVVMTSGGPLGATTTVVYYLYEEAFRRFDFGRAAAVATLLMVAIGLLSIPMLMRARKEV